MELSSGVMYGKSVDSRTFHRVQTVAAKQFNYVMSDKNNEKFCQNLRIGKERHFIFS
jgi:hypothetical protein